MPFSKNFWITSALILSDFFSFVLSLYFALIAVELTSSHLEYSAPGDITSWIGIHWLMAGFLVIWIGARLRHYFYRKPFWSELKEILRTVIIFAIAEAAIVALLKLDFSRYLWSLTWVLVAVLVPSARMMTKVVLHKLNLWQRPTYIIGNGKNALDAYKAISEESNMGLRVIGFIAEKKSAPSTTTLAGLPVLHVDTEWLESGIDKQMQFMVAVENDEGETRSAWLRQFMIKGFRYVSVIPTLRGMPLDSTDMSFIFSHEVMILRVHHNLAKLSSQVSKRLFDIFASLACIILLSPVLIYISRKVKKDGGPAIYGHERIGKDGVPFKCLKFRSMAINSKELLETLLATDPEAKAEWDQTFKLKNDPRVTKIGAFLRRTSLDELPQLFNVLKGEMSLVGPRPVIYAELERYEEQIDYYLLSKPGMTGLWQVSGRSDVDYETRVYFDVWYVTNWSMWNDIVILFKTIGVVLKRDGAY